MWSLRSMCAVFQKDRCRDSDVRERCGLKEDVVTRVERVCCGGLAIWEVRMKVHLQIKSIERVYVMEKPNPRANELSIFYTYRLRSLMH
ncbi:hypothetical protein EVAR_51686_1 [Eumeta japonica]|uniref:Uncharacterized protein n=1 Tax=Eumeta variegata TaxID=151549 RepID=A0A4C1Y4S7_EUMVA|nr:hypothetical protein EVAR_51686_1 [Eumeta japonica]